MRWPFPFLDIVNYWFTYDADNRVTVSGGSLAPKGDGGN